MDREVAVSKATPTPGPWELTFIPQGPRGAAGFCFIHRGGDIIAPSLPNGAPHHEANARLMVASPTMYEYITKKANEGDEDAKIIIEQIW